MSSKSANRPTHKPFESRNDHGQFTKITIDMIKSKAWEHLSLRQRGLYVTMKALYNPKIYTAGINVKESNEQFTFPKEAWGPLYNNNGRAWRLDLAALINYGFINLAESGWTTRTKNVYRFSDRWKKID